MPENKVNSFFFKFCHEIHTSLTAETNCRQGKDRNQLAPFPACTDDSLDADNETRMIDLFVDSLDLNSCGFDILLVMIKKHAVIILF